MIALEVCQRCYGDSHDGPCPESSTSSTASNDESELLKVARDIIKHATLDGDGKRLKTFTGPWKLLMRALIEAVGDDQAEKVDAKVKADLAKLAEWLWTNVDFSGYSSDESIEAYETCSRAVLDEVPDDKVPESLGILGKWAWRTLDILEIDPSAEFIREICEKVMYG